MIAYKNSFKRLRDGVSNRAVTKEQRLILSWVLFSSSINYIFMKNI